MHLIDANPIWIFQTIWAPNSSEMVENASHFRFISLRFWSHTKVCNRHASEIFTKMSKLIFVYISLTVWSHRLTVRTPGFHPGNRSSILLGITKVNTPSSLGVFTLVGFQRKPNSVRSANSVIIFDLKEFSW